MTTQTESKTSSKPEIIVRTIYRNGVEITIIEEKQPPLRIGGFEL